MQSSRGWFTGRRHGINRHNGKLTDADFKENLIPAMDEAIKSHGKIRILFQMEDVEGITAHGAWHDIMT